MEKLQITLVNIICNMANLHCSKWPKIEQSIHLVTLVVAERSLPTPQVCGSNPAICQILYIMLLLLKRQTEQNRGWELFICQTFKGHCRQHRKSWINLNACRVANQTISPSKSNWNPSDLFPRNIKVFQLKINRNRRKQKLGKNKRQQPNFLA